MGLVPITRMEPGPDPGETVMEPETGPDPGETVMEPETGP